MLPGTTVEPRTAAHIYPAGDRAGGQDQEAGSLAKSGYGDVRLLLVSLSAGPKSSQKGLAAIVSESRLRRPAPPAVSLQTEIMSP